VIPDYLKTLLEHEPVEDTHPTGLESMRIGRAVATYGNQVGAVLSLEHGGKISRRDLKPQAVGLASASPSSAYPFATRYWRIEDHETQSHSQRNREVGDLFSLLAQVWINETSILSSLPAIFMHEAHQQIIGLGPEAIPFLLERLPEEPERWLWALQVITRQNPVPDDADAESAVAAWLEWARERRLLT